MYVNCLIAKNHSNNVLRILTNEQESPYKWFEPKVPVFSKAVFSIKRLRLDSWFDQEDIVRLISNE